MYLYMCFTPVLGILLTYTLLQISLWWFFHTTALFWTVFWPLRARSLKKSSKLRCIYIACTIAGFCIPLVPIISAMADFSERVGMDDLFVRMNVTFISGGLGFANPGFPPTLCVPSNADVIFYSLVLPINIIAMVGIAELILIFWRIHKVSS